MLPDLSTVQWLQFLPKPTKIFGKSVIDGCKKFGAGGDPVKAETAAGSAGGSGAGSNLARDGDADAETGRQGDGDGNTTVPTGLETSCPTLEDLCNMHDVPKAKALNSLDVIAVQQAIETHLMRHAVCLGYG